MGCTGVDADLVAYCEVSCTHEGRSHSLHAPMASFTAEELPCAREWSPMPLITASLRLPSSVGAPPGPLATADRMPDCRTHHHASHFFEPTGSPAIAPLMKSLG